MFSKTKRLLAALVLLFLSSITLLDFHPSYAFFFEPRSVTLSNASASASVSHTFSLQPSTTSDVGSLVFEYCSNSPQEFDSCTAPAGLDVSGASLTSQSGNIGFSINSVDSTANKLVLSRTSAPALTVISKYVFSNVVNPSTAGQTVYVRLTSYASGNGSGSFIDKGAVAFAVQSIFSVNTFVPPFLRLCVAVTVAPDCSTMSGDSIDLGILSSQHANFGQSQFTTATNDPQGYVVFALGTTMTSGNNTISAVGSPSASLPGTQQFGINLRANLAPVVGQDPVGLGTAVPTPNYNIPNRFMYLDGDSIVSSNLNTDYNRMTVSYLVNVTPVQPPGVYATTITYVATVQF